MKPHLFLVIITIFATGQNVVGGDQEISLLGKTGKSFRVGIRAVGTNGLYWCAEFEKPINASRSTIAQWETFDLEYHDGWFALKSHSNQKYVRMTASDLRACDSTITQSTKFRLGACGKFFVFKTDAFVCSERASGKVVANRPTPGTWELHEIVFSDVYAKPDPLPPGVLSKFVEAGEWHTLERAAGVPGIGFKTYFRNPPGAEVRDQYFLTGDGPTRTLNGTDTVEVGASGIYCEVAVRVPYATNVIYASSAGALGMQVPFLPTLPLIPINVDFFK